MKTNFWLIKLYFLIGLIFLFSCNNEQVLPEGPIGPISAEEFALSTPPTFAELDTAFQNILEDNPTLTQDEDAFVRALFDEVNRLHEMKDGRKTFGILERLTLEEWIVVLTNIYDTYKAYPAKGIAEAAVKEHMSCNKSFADTKADAFRHAYWSGLMTLFANHDFAEKLGTAHEANSKSEKAKAMDLHNNMIGRDLALQFPNATEEEFLRLLLERRFTFIKDPREIPEGTGLVYFKNENKYDITLKGTLTNPDAGRDWDIDLFLYQCGNELRGEYHITADFYFQRRRFVGILDDSGEINLTVSKPYSFEGLSNYCRDVLFMLDGTPDQLTGSWTASNCPQGGNVSLTKQ